MEGTGAAKQGRGEDQIEIRLTGQGTMELRKHLGGKKEGSKRRVKAEAIIRREKER